VEDTGKPPVIRLAFSLEPTDWCLDYHEEFIDPEQDLTNCPLVVAAGKGMGSSGAIAKLGDLARRFGSGLGVTRPVALNSWYPLSGIIGLSGISIKPELCLVLGASGSTPFVKGIEKSGTIIAVNRDPDALIFRRCQVGVLDDCQAFAKELMVIVESEKA
jgi:electron transfer flavoprotein alpha subunit